MTWIDWVIAAFVLFAAIQGIRRGALAALVGLLAVVAGYLAASAWYRPLAEFIERLLPLSPSWSATAAFLALLLLVHEAVGILVVLTTRTSNIPRVSRLTGAVVAGVRGAVLATALLIAALASPLGAPIQRDVERSSVAPFAVTAFRDGLRALAAVLPPSIKPFGTGQAKF